MSRIRLFLVSAVVAACVVGCAQCDTCDDFPAPCTGPNCGQNGGGILDYMTPSQGPGSPPMGGVAAPVGIPSYDAAGPAPNSPNTIPSGPVTTPPPTPSVDPTGPPTAGGAPMPN